MPSRARAAAQVIAISELTRQDAITTYGLDGQRVTTIYPGVDRTFFQARGTQRKATDAVRLIFPGAPVKRKNLDLVLKALATAPSGSALGRASLEISGADAGRFPDQAARITELGLADRVRWLGVVPLTEMPAVLASSDLCVYPSLYEGFGFPPLEAMAVGVPVVASRASCLPEILGDSALMVDPTDVRAFGEAVEAVLTNPELRSRLINAGRERAGMFTWERCAEQTLNVYVEALSRAV